MPWILLRAPLAGALIIATAGCASFSADGGFSPVQQAARQRLGAEVELLKTDADLQRAADRTAALLRAPLTADAAVQVALLHHRGLQAAFAELGIAEADLVQAGTLPNPGFGFARLTRGGELEIERSLHIGLGRLLALPLARQAEERRFAQAQGGATLAVLTLAADVRRAWVQAVAAEEQRRYALQVQDAAEAGAELARRMEKAGNFSPLQRLREQAFHADAVAAATRTQLQATAARERLARLLGLDSPSAMQLPERLPDLPPAPADRPGLERAALAERLDVQAAREQVAQTAKRLGLTRTTRFVDVLELGAQRNSASGAPVQRGWEVRFELPLFDWGTARVARAESLYLQALHQAAQTAIDARSEVREAWATYRSAWDLARHGRDEAVPLAQAVSEQNLLRYNGMLIGVFELLADARAQVATVSGAIGALRDFWLAQADLELALVGRPALAGLAATPLAAPAAADRH